MKTINLIKKPVWHFVFWLLMATPVWAAAAREEDNSDLFVWIFLGFCALIVVAQLIPALFVLLGFVKGVRKETKQPVESTQSANSIDTLLSQDGARD